MTNDKEAQRGYSKKWRDANKEALRASKRLYESQPHRRELKREKSKQDYLINRNLYLARQEKRRKERKDFVDRIAMQHGCQNPECKWQGEFDPCQLTFHHVDPSQKEVEIAKMYSWSYESIVAEINKCVVFCRNCHPLADKGLILITESMMCSITTPTVIQQGEP